MKYLVFLLSVSMMLTPIAAQNYGDIFVTDKVLVQRCSIEGVSTRTIAVGHPGGFNYAFDAVNCALVFAWYGGFLDFSGETNGRGGKGCKVLGIRRPLGIAQIPLRVSDSERLPQNLEFNGYRRDNATGAPMFLFSVDGVSVRQLISSDTSDTLSIRMIFPETRTQDVFYKLNSIIHKRVEVSDGLKWVSPEVILIPSTVTDATISLTLRETDEVFHREVPEYTGSQVFQNFCSTCHSTDGTKLIGPSFKGLLGREQIVTRGGRVEKITVDEGYILESIMKPQAAIVKGYEQVPMADFSGVLTDQQIASLVDFLVELE